MTRMTSLRLLYLGVGALALSLLGTLSTTRAEEPARPVPTAAAAAATPAPAPAQPVRPAVPHEMVVLKNGLRVIVQEDHRSPFITVCVVYHVGALDELPGKSGLAHLFEHLMFESSQGTLPYTSTDMLWQMGVVNWNGTTHWDKTVYYETIPAVNLEPALWMEAERMQHLSAAESGLHLGNNRDIVKNERRQRIETVAYQGAWEAVAQNLFTAPHPYSRHSIGSMDDLDGATVRDMSAFYKNWYGPNNATLVLVGDVQPDAALRLVNRYFAAMPSRGAPVMQRQTVPVIGKAARLRLQDPIAKAPALILAWPSPAFRSPDDSTADLVSWILASRLRKRLLRQTNLAIQVNVHQESRSLQSIFDVLVSAKNAAQLGKVLTFTDVVLDELRQDTASEEEVTRARLAITTQYFWNLESPVMRAQMLADWAHEQGQADGFRAELARYRNITAADVGRFVRETLRPESRVVVEVEPVTKESR